MANVHCWHCKGKGWYIRPPDIDMDDDVFDEVSYRVVCTKCPEEIKPAIDLPKCERCQDVGFWLAQDTAGYLNVFWCDCRILKGFSNEPRKH